MRALLFALMAKGKSQIHNPLFSPDTEAMIQAIELFGAKVKRKEKDLVVEGTSGKLRAAEDVIECGNSGQILRFIGALSALNSSYTVLTGDDSIRHNRPVLPLLSALNQLGAMAVSSKLDGSAPIIIKGPLKTHFAKLCGKDSQPVSALLMLGAFYPIELQVTDPGETPWIDLTLSWLNRLGVCYKNEEYQFYSVKPNEIQGFDYRVPADFSSAAYPLVAGLITQSKIEIDNLDLEDVQGDKAILSLLDPIGKSIDVNPFIDALPILAVLGCFAKGQTNLYNGQVARKKESDRIRAISTELKKMGADIQEKEDGLLIIGKKLKGATLDSHKDHRIAMSLCIAALGAEGQSTIEHVGCVAKSYPSFFEDLRKMGAQLEFL